MDYLHRLNRSAESALVGKRFQAESESNPVTYEKWESDNKIGFKATSSFNKWSSCATRLVSYFYVSGVDASLVVRDFDSNGVPSIWIPTGTTIITEVEPYDTSGASNTSYKLSTEPAVERAGVDVEVMQFNNKALETTALNVLKQEQPDLFNFDDFELEDFEAWWIKLNKSHADTVNRIFSSNVSTFFTPIATHTLRDTSSSAHLFNQEGVYRIDSIYGYDWEAEVSSQRGDYSLGKGDDFMGYSWAGVGYWSLTSLYYAMFFFAFFRSTITYGTRMVGGVLRPYVTWGSGKLLSVGSVAKLALAAVETLAIDIYLIELPYYIRKVDATQNHNGCGFPPGGHYESLNVHTYDASARDWQGTPHCKVGEHKEIESESPLTYNPEVPCCPDETNYNKATNLCEGANGATWPNGDGNIPAFNPTASGEPQENKGMKVAAGLLLGVVAITVITGINSSK